MEIFALVGKSGSGKSHKSHIVAGTYDIEYMIDDGLLIKGNKILAGVSAKREKTKFGAVRRAVFKNEIHRYEVRKALEKHKPEKLLVIGTSEHMIQSILAVLDLERKYTLIRIEDISTQQEINAAFHTRRTMGKHVIPVPTFEVKKAFSGYFIDSIRHWVRKGDSKGTSTSMTSSTSSSSESAVNPSNTSMSETTGHDDQDHISGNTASESRWQASGITAEQSSGYADAVTETTVVRPTFSYLGSYEIKGAAIKAIIGQAAVEAEGISRVNAVSFREENDGIKILVTVTINCKENIPFAINGMAEKTKRTVEHMTGINVLEINTVIKALVQ